MRRWWMGLFVVPSMAALYACSSSAPPPATPADSASKTQGDTCPVVDPGPPPVCPEGCAWDGEACRKHSGIIVNYAVDGGTPPPPPPPPESSQ